MQIITPALGSTGNAR